MDDLMPIQTPLFGTAAHDAEVQLVAQDWKHAVRGVPEAPILVLCEPPSIEAAKQSLPMDLDLHQMWAKMASSLGFVQNDFFFLGMCPPVPKAMQNSVSKSWEYIQPYAKSARELLSRINPRLVVTLGAYAGRAMSGRPLKVTTARGRFHPSKDYPLPFFQMMSPKLVSIQPDYTPIMQADLSTLLRVKQAGWDTSILTPTNTNYYWCDDLSDLLANPPKVLAFDTEGTGLNVMAEDFRVITVQITIREGETRVCRICPDYFPDHPSFANQSRETCALLRSQIKKLMENPAIVKLAHNGKYDFKAMRSIGIEMTNWWDTELMARFVNENFLQYNIDDLTRIYVADMGGFNDVFNTMIDKSKMIEVPPEDVLNDKGELVTPGLRRYAGGDPDATFRLAKALSPLLKEDPENTKVMNRVHRRALFALTKTVETFGFTIDKEALQAFQDELGVWITQEERELVRMVPAAIRRKYLTDPKGFKFSRDEVMRDVLFSKEGFGLTPKVFTESTMNNTDPETRVPSVSTKDHMPYFITDKKAGTFVTRFIELKKAQKMMDTYAKGFWKYIKTGADGVDKIIPEFNFRTNTKRTQSQNPNGQNFPKRGKFAKPFRKLFSASPGKVLVASDLSQAELRIAAWMANERNMLSIYQNDGDIHVATAASVMHMSVPEFLAQEEAFRKKHRQNAKPTNFGFIYGAREQTFTTVAKTAYGVDFTLAEATELRRLYFETYPGLIPWHEKTKLFAKEHGYVKSLHGLTRHLPSIWSKDWSIQSGAERNAINSPVQNFGSDLGVIAFTRLSAQADPNLIRPIGFIHDQLIAEVDEAYVAEGMGWLKWLMENPPLREWFGIIPPLPIKSDPEWGLNLGSTTELADNKPEANEMREIGRASCRERV